MATKQAQELYDAIRLEAVHDTANVLLVAHFNRAHDFLQETALKSSSLPSTMRKEGIREALGVLRRRVVFTECDMSAAAAARAGIDSCIAALEELLEVTE